MIRCGVINRLLRIFICSGPTQKDFSCIRLQVFMTFLYAFMTFHKNCELNAPTLEWLNKKHVHEYSINGRRTSGKQLRFDPH